MTKPHGSIRLTVVPCTLDEARAFIKQHHRHHLPPVGHKFSLAVADEAGVVRGVATVGRPVARLLDDGWTLEVNRVATDGCPNACSALYGAARRATFALGYRKLVTYTIPEEGGVSLRASGWKCIGQAGNTPWNHKSRPRVEKNPVQIRFRWEIEP